MDNKDLQPYEYLAKAILRRCIAEDDPRDLHQWIKESMYLMEKDPPRRMTVPISDLAIEYDEELSEFQKYLPWKVEDNFFDFTRVGYMMNMDTIHTINDLLAWILHLNEMSWMTSKLMLAFISAVCKYKGWEIPRL